MPDNQPLEWTGPAERSFEFGSVVGAGPAIQRRPVIWVEAIGMAKPSQGRFDGVWGMRKFTAAQLFAWADQHEARITDPTNTDDPKWLQRRADRLRRVATAKQNALELKQREQRPR